MSFHDWPLFGERAFTGLENYQELGKDRQYLKSLISPFAIRRWSRHLSSFSGSSWRRWSATISAILASSAPSSSASGHRLGFESALGGCWTTVSAYSTRYCWTSIWSQSAALLENHTAMNVIILSVVWKTVGFTMILLLAGLQDIPDELYESAEVDGAGYFRKLYTSLCH